MRPLARQSRPASRASDVGGWLARTAAFPFESGGSYGVAASDVPQADGVRADIWLDLIGGRALSNGSWTTVDAALSCTRSGTATYIDAYGNVSDVSANVLRYGSAGLLVEESRINLCIRSAELDNAAWTAENVTVTANASAAPDGTTTADKIVTVNDASKKRDIFLTGGLTTTATPYVFSCYVKAGEYGFASFIAMPSSGTTRTSIVVNLTTGAITQTGTQGSPTNVTSGTVASVNGWWRVWIKVDGEVSSTARVAVCPSNSGTPSVDAGLNPLFAGDGTSGIYAWGTQIEAGAFVTSYIRTTTASVTRSADNISFASTTGQLLSRGTWSGEYTEVAGPVSTVAYVVRMRVDGSNVIEVTRSVGNKLNAGTVVSGSDTARISTPNNVVAGSTYKFAFAYDTNNVGARYTASLGADQTDDTSCAMPTGAFATTVGANFGGANPINGNMKSLAHWTDRRVSNAGLAGLVA